MPDGETQEGALLLSTQKWKKYLELARNGESSANV